METCSARGVTGRVRAAAAPSLSRHSDKSFSIYDIPALNGHHPNWRHVTLRHPARVTATLPRELFWPFHIPDERRPARPSEGALAPMMDERVGARHR